MVRVYPKDEPGKVYLQAPDSTGFHKYYYSQPTSDGKRDNNSLEDLFSKTESKWPPIVERMKRKEGVNDVLEDIFSFTSLQRARVPASRDATEKLDAERVMANVRALDAAGKLPPKPKGHEDILERVQVSIDPHRSIHAMVQTVNGMASVVDRIGIGALHNMTDIPFLTSDNPVAWFDPSMSEAAMRPYVLSSNGPVVLLFPVTPKLMIYGHSSMKAGFSREGLGHSELTKRKSVKEMNRQICRFAYRVVFAQAPGQESLIVKYAGLSPILSATAMLSDSRQSLRYEMIFGKRERKPKWEDKG